MSTNQERFLEDMTSELKLETSLGEERSKESSTMKQGSSTSFESLGS